MAVGSIGTARSKTSRTFALVATFRIDTVVRTVIRRGIETFVNVFASLRFFVLFVTSVTRAGDASTVR